VRFVPCPRMGQAPGRQTGRTISEGSPCNGSAWNGRGELWPRHSPHYGRSPATRARAALGFGPEHVCYGAARGRPHRTGATRARRRPHVRMAAQLLAVSPALSGPGSSGPSIRHRRRRDPPRPARLGERTRSRDRRQRGRIRRRRATLLPAWSFIRYLRYTRRAGAGSSMRSAGSRAEAAQQLPRDHDPLDLVRALVDLRDLGVAHHPLDRVLLDVPVAAEDLHGVGRHRHRRV
jgi:hypothetical protein